MDIVHPIARLDAGSNNSDPELVRRHQVKVDARIEQIDESLEEFRKRRILLDRQAQDVELRLAAVHSEWDKCQLKREIDNIANMKKLHEAEQPILLRERHAIFQLITVEAFAAAPVRRIPTDVMFEIFMAAKSPEIPMVGQGMGNFLSLVCSHWRAVACDQPGLWLSFSFPLFGRKITELVKIHLEHSRCAPLTVEVDARCRMQGGSNGNAEITLLAAHAKHLFSLAFIMENWDRSGRLPSLQPLRGKLPRLEILEFSRKCRPVSDEFEFAPSLHSLKLSNGMALAEEHKLGGTQIRSFSSDALTGQYLAWFPHLNFWTCRVEMYPLAKSPPLHHSTPVPTSRLTSWKILFDFPASDRPGAATSANNWDPPHIFHGVDTPALRELDIMAFYHPSQLRDFLARCQCNLTALVLRSCVMRVVELLDILEYTPNLESLAVVGGHPTIVTNRLFHFLTVRPDTLTALSNLSSLTLDGSFVFDNTVLLDMLATRTAPAAARSNGTHVCLTDVYLSLRDRVVEADVVGFRSLEGITVVLK
ncbi:hypothetical protein C8R44DRAFT_863060 [Mycena epipterygia]|nr:hypothetical protein C8R44DRAFT_863060 [Mycena epipterygia]